MQFELAMVLYSDGEGALKNEIAKVVLKAKGTELRTPTRGQHATTVETRNDRLRHLVHVVETEVRMLHIPPVFARLLHEA
eukprot:5569777-Pyramimonas_sp.AAC.1